MAGFCCERSRASGEDRFAAPVLDFLQSDCSASSRTCCLPTSPRNPRDRIEQDARSVRALLANGGTVEADAIVAADGIRSRVRQCLLGSDEPMFSGTVVYRGVVAAARIAHVHPPGLNHGLGPGRHAVAYWIAGGRLLALNAAVADAENALESWRMRPRMLRCVGTLGAGRTSCSAVRPDGQVPARRGVRAASHRALVGQTCHAVRRRRARDGAVPSAGRSPSDEDAYVLAEYLRGVDTGGVPKASCVTSKSGAHALRSFNARRAERPVTSIFPMARRSGRWTPRTRRC